MSNPTRYQDWRQPILINRLGYTEEPEPDPDPADPIDYAASTEGAAVQVAISTTVYAELLAGETVTTGNSGGTTPDNPSNANDTTATLGALHFSQTNSERTSFAGFGTVSYWWAVDFGSAVLVERMRVWDPVAVGSPVWITTGGWPTTTIEFSDDGSSWTASTYVLTSQSVPTGNTSPYATTATEWVYTLDASSTHRYWRIFKTGSPGGFVLGDAMCSWYIDGASSSGSTWNPAPQANDGDVATSAFSDVTGPTLRVALFVERLIYRIELDVGTDTAGATVFELYGSDPTFTTTTLLTTLSFTATGTYTLDTVAGSWLADEAFQYFQLEHVSGGGADREFYEVRLYSAVGVPGVSDHPSLSGRDTTDSHPADAVSYDNGTSGLTATDVQAAIDEVVAGGGGGVTVEDEGTPLSTTATTLDFVGAGVVASGTGATKTITISGGGGGSAELDYAEATSPVTVSATTEATATTLVTGGSVAYDGSTVVMVEAYVPYIDYTGGGAQVFWLVLYDGSSSIGKWSVEQPVTGSTIQPAHRVARRLTPSNASHTYSLRAYVNTSSAVAGMGAGGSGNYMPAFIRIVEA